LFDKLSTFSKGTSGKESQIKIPFLMEFQRIKENAFLKPKRFLLAANNGALKCVLLFEVCWILF